MDRLWGFLHLFFAFSFVGTLVLAEWNGRAARATHDWGHRALLFQVVHRSTRAVGLGSLVLTGVVGQVYGAGLGYRMSADAWMRWVTLAWGIAIAVHALVVLPAAARLAATSAVAAGGGTAEGWDLALVRWRAGNVAMSALYLALLALMVWHWRS